MTCWHLILLGLFSWAVELWGGKRCCLLVGRLSLVVTASESSVTPRLMLAEALQPVFQVSGSPELPAEPSQPAWVLTCAQALGFLAGAVDQSPDLGAGAHLPPCLPVTVLLGLLIAGRGSWGDCPWARKGVLPGVCAESALWHPVEGQPRKWSGPVGAVFSHQAGAAHGKLLTYTCGFQA